MLDTPSLSLEMLAQVKCHGLAKKGPVGGVPPVPYIRLKWGGLTFQTSILCNTKHAKQGK